jgi:hypothetical protein
VGRAKGWLLTILPVNIYVTIICQFYILYSRAEVYELMSAETGIRGQISGAPQPHFISNGIGK